MTKKLTQPLKWQQPDGFDTINRDGGVLLPPRRPFHNDPLAKKGNAMAVCQSTDSASSLPFVPGVRFAEIPDAPGYVAGDDGTVWSCWKTKGTGYGKPDHQVVSNKWKQLKPYCRKEDGRKRYTIKSTRKTVGRYRRCYGSALVLEAFVGPRPEGMEACHNNGVCIDDFLLNLRWDTTLENHQDMLRHGTQIVGETHPCAKLTDRQIQEIILIRKSGMKLKHLAVMFGVTEARISQICIKGKR